MTISVAGNTYTAPYTQGSDGTWSADVQVALPGGTPAGDLPMTISSSPDTGTSVPATLTVTTAVPRVFSDVNPGDMFYDESMWIASEGITTGWSDGTFRPVTPVNRDAMAAYLYRMAGSPEVTTPRSQPFTDVTPETEHHEAIIWAYQQGIVKGYEDGTFRPTTPISRDAMAAFLYRMQEQQQITLGSEG